MKRTAIVVLGISFLIAHGALAQTSEPSVIHAFKSAQPIRLDGILDEPAWQQAQRISNFTQRELEEGKPATERTEVAVVYTDRALYFGIFCYDSEPDKIVAREMRRDFRHRAEDNFEIVLDTYHDRRNSYHFIINPNGARRDELVTDEGRSRNDDWNGVWDVRARITDEGWFAEIEIPFSSLKFSNAEEQVWGVNFERNISRKHEQVLWQGWSRNYDLEQVSHAGTLLGLRGVSGGHLLELKPYFTGGLETKTSAKTDRVFRTGGDLDYLLTSNLKLNVTLHTDFAQVESDRAIVNLSRFSVYYPEKRGFFLEGRDAFSFGGHGSFGSVFYSRRIGIKDGEEVPIIGGARLIGKTGSTNIGLLSLQTARKDDEPTTNYSVVRLKQDVAGQSNVGMILTTKNSSQTSNMVAGFDANYVTSRFLGENNLSIGTAIAHSFTRDSSNTAALAYSAYLNAESDKFDYNVSLATVQRNFDPQIGFLRRTNYKRLNTELQLSPRPAFLPWIRQMEFVPFEISAYYTDTTNKLESISSEFRPLGFRTKSGENFEFNIQRNYDRLDEPFEILDEVTVLPGGYWNTRQEIQFSTYSGRKISMGLEGSTGTYYSGKRRQMSFRFTANLSKHFKCSFDYEANQLAFDSHSFTTHELSGRAEYAFSPLCYATFFGQWNNEDEELLINYRLNWIPQIGSDFYLAINQLFDTTGGKIRLTDTTVLSKLIWRFTL